MSLDEPLRIDVVAVKGKQVRLFIVEGREWSTIKGGGSKLLAKVWNLKRYADSEEAKKKYKGKNILISIDSKHNLPENIKKILKEEGVEIWTDHKK